jgi:phosphoglycolate phosphatase-like HAD superfamily hydrolase
VTRQVLSELTTCAPELIVFDKGGTLIDCHGVWSEWAIELARRLESAVGYPMADRLFDGIGFDARSRSIDPEGPLALESMASLRSLVLELLRESGLTHLTAEETVAATWYAPDPVDGMQPLADIPGLFDALRGHGLKIAIATMDDRAPTEATLAFLGVAAAVDALVCADDGIAPKPAPDMVWAVCRTTGVEPPQTVVVGDAVTDLQMGQAAGAGLVVGVLSGVAGEEMLAPEADVLLASVAELV